MLLSREEAKQEMKECEGVEECSMSFKIIDKIYDSFEEELEKAREEGYVAAVEDCFTLLNGKEK